MLNQAVNRPTDRARNCSSLQPGPDHRHLQSLDTAQNCHVQNIGKFM